MIKIQFSRSSFQPSQKDLKENNRVDEIRCSAITRQADRRKQSGVADGSITHLGVDGKLLPSVINGVFSLLGGFHPVSQN